MDSSRAKIICTIGPSSSNRAVLFHLIMSGMDVARLNFRKAEGIHRHK